MTGLWSQAARSFHEGPVDLSERIADRVGAEVLRTGWGERRAVSNDRWPYRTMGILGGELTPMPGVVAAPRTEAETQALVELASELGVPVVPYGAGSSVVGGASCWGGELVLDLKAMDRVLEVDEDDLVVRVQAGMNGQRLEDELQAHGLTLGHFPSSIACSTVGGWVAARSAGQLSSRYGKIEDMVLGLRMATPGAGLLDTDDLPGTLQLFTGSEGCLGAITEARFRVHPKPEHFELRGFSFSDLPSALSAGKTLMHSGMGPSVLRVYDPLDTILALGGEGHESGSEAGQEGADGEDGEAQEAVARLRDRLKLPDKLDALDWLLDRPRLRKALRLLMGRRCLVIVGFEGSEEATFERMERLKRSWRRLGGRDLGEGPGRKWLAKRHSVSFNLPKVMVRGLFGDTMELACAWSVMPELYTEVVRIMGDEAMVMAHFSHAYVEGCTVYFSFSAKAADTERARERYLGLWRRALDRAYELGAVCTHHHGVGALKRAWAEREAGAALTAWIELKRELDPAGVMNPGVLFRAWGER